MLGSGLWGLGSDSYGEFSKEYAKNVIKYQIEKGISFFDTSDSYGDGRSEIILGEVVSELNIRKDVSIATKVGLLPHRGFFMPSDFSLKHIQKKFQESLTNLKTSYLDIYQLHSPSKEDLYSIQESMPWLIKKREEGIIKNIGISARSPNDAIFFLNNFSLDVIQCNFNLIDQRLIETGLLDYCKKNSIKIIARTPLAFGFLTGKLTSSKEQFTKNDHRYKWPQEQLDLWASAHLEFKSINEKLDLSPLALAHQFIKFFKPTVFTTICGMHSFNEVDENIGSYYHCDELLNKTIFEIQKIYSSKKFFIDGIKSKGPQKLSN